ncbi:hypothetical protein CYMTET_24326 [Cymbomonas tetramitiformis]|uniref:DOMON domain-containing protein n=1 Tax=Cymbomonas tetramitiformis TaxID=36881 RepID=A0AAE0L0D4_9CHLO|nr:hypothetical protein CYMTET_24326 [Cymbomonas tetramitiformis]|eukprot:gene6272-7520_t
MYWNVAGDAFELALRVRTSGWIGFGIAEPGGGGMKGADIVTGFVDAEGVGKINDMYAINNGQPYPDSCENWELIRAEKIGDTTTIELKRLLNTGDSQDRAVDTELGKPTKIIYSWGPLNNGKIAYHAANRFTKRIYFGGGDDQVEILEGIKSDPYTASFSMLNNYTVSPTTTVYQAKCFDLPEVDDVHAIALEHFIQESTAEFVHHFVLEGYHKSNCNSRLQRPIWAWAPGTQHLILPTKAGFRIGPTGNGFRSFRLETHYNNPSLKYNLVDKSGVVMHYTTELREHDAGMFQLGDPSVGLSFQSLPEGSSKYEFECPSACTQSWSHDITVFSTLLHMHSHGVKMLTEQYNKEGAKLRTTANIDWYDPEIQDNIFLLPFKVNRGDSFKTTCFYETPDNLTMFGPNSEDEMCIDFMYYYPILRDPQTVRCDYESHQNCSSRLLSSGTVRSIDRQFGDESGSCQSVFLAEGHSRP